ncbi:MAG: hypothetical protein CEO12_270 [Parcubacteria group bacterium Gr01-1014_46]|nr:MAG: hypothetical protein CEO12_270 [Parcubacteria group bacterium Gr01-1014_46]
MKKNIKKIIPIITLIIMLVPGFFGVYAQTPPPNNPTPYTVLTTLPGIGTQTTLTSYLPAAFNLAIGIAVALAFVMITFGGVTYATSDAITGKAKGREYIEDALWGLLLVIGSYVILNTLNPQILNFSLRFDRPTVPVSSVTLIAGTPLDPAARADDASVRATLVGIGINHPPCLAGETQGCTNVNGLPAGAVTGLLTLKKACNGCTIMITGGTEGGHATHGPGKQIVDLRPENALNYYIWGDGNTPPDGTTRTKNLPNGQSIKFVYETAGGNVRGTSTGAHWHTVISN